MIEIRDLTFDYRGGDFLLRVPELRIAAGATVAVIGPSGTGKTTLLNLMAGVLIPGRGSVLLGGEEISAMGDAARRAFRIAKVGLVFQEFELLEYLSVLDNILLPYRISPALVSGGEERERARDLAERVGIADKLSRSPNRLSQGERQRVAICRSLLTQPTVVLADEPTGNLDPGNTDRVLEMVFEYVAESGATLVSVTHEQHLVERFERVIDISDFGAAGDRDA